MLILINVAAHNEIETLYCDCKQKSTLPSAFNLTSIC